MNRINICLLAAFALLSASCSTDERQIVLNALEITPRSLNIACGQTSALELAFTPENKADFLKKCPDAVLMSVISTSYFQRPNTRCLHSEYIRTGKIATEIMFSEPFKTAPREISDVTINLISDKYFNGDEVAQAYPQYSNTKGKATVPVRVETTGDVTKYFYHIFLNDLSDTEKYSDDSIIYSLVNGGGITVPETLFYLEYDKTGTIVGVAKDKNGKYGNVYRQVITPTKSGCSPISEFQPITDDSAASIRLDSPKPAMPVFKTSSADVSATSDNNGIPVVWL